METISLAFIALTIISFVVLLKFIFHAISKTSWEASKKKRIKLTIASAIIAWTAFVSIWSATGKMEDFSMFPLNVMPVLAVPMITILIFTFSKSTQTIIANLTHAQLIALQSFRIFVELLLWRLFVLDKMPVQMSFEGRNWDVLTGITALVVAYLASLKRISNTGILIWNLFGLGLLINILSIAILSMPTPFRVFMNEPSNTIVTQFPVSLLPGLLVPLAYGLHFLSLRKLSLEKNL
jgi:hypothetical protein